MNQEILRAIRYRGPLHGRRFKKFSSREVYDLHKWYVRTQVNSGRLQSIYSILRQSGLPSGVIREIADRLLDKEFDEKHWHPHREAYGEVVHR